MTPKQQVEDIAESLRGVNNSDSLKYNVQMICDMVIESLKSIAGSERWQRTEYQNEVIKHWEDASKESANLVF
jgi:hypothetical protein